MKTDVSPEIVFKTARSGGKGGQNVNKVETMVEGNFAVASSTILTAEQIEMVLKNLAHRITKDGNLQVKSQEHRSQLSNKQEVIEKINGLITSALVKRVKRIRTKPSFSSRQKRLESKKKLSEHKENRKKIRF